MKNKIQAINEYQPLQSFIFVINRFFLIDIIKVPLNGDAVHVVRIVKPECTVRCVCVCVCANVILFLLIYEQVCVKMAADV